MVEKPKNALICDVSKHDVPVWLPDFTQQYPTCFTYDYGDQRCAFFGKNYPLSNCALIDRAEGEDLREWACRRFGANNFRVSRTEVGVVDEMVWRPGLAPFNQFQGILRYSDLQHSNASQGVRLVLEKLGNV